MARDVPTAAESSPATYVRTLSRWRPEIGLGHGRGRAASTSPDGRGQPRPRPGRERMRHPVIAGVRVVFDDDERTTRFQVARETCDRRGLLGARHEVEAVGRHKPVELRQLRRSSRKSATRVVDRHARKRPRHGIRVRSAPRRDQRQRCVAPGPSRSASASVKAPSPAPMSAQIGLPGAAAGIAGRSRLTWSV